MSSMVITDSQLPGCPILFATKGFAETVGSHREDLLGKSVFQVASSHSMCCFCYTHATALPQWYIALYCFLACRACAVT